MDNTGRGGGGGGSSLVKSEFGFLLLVRDFIRWSFFQPRCSFSQNIIQDLHVLRRVAFCIALDHSDLRPSSSLSVPDVFGQQHPLRSRGTTQTEDTIAEISDYKLWMTY